MFKKSLITSNIKKYNIEKANKKNQNELKKTIFKLLNEEKTESIEKIEEEARLQLDNLNGYKSLDELSKDMKDTITENYNHYIFSKPQNTELYEHIEQCKKIYIQSQSPKLGFFLLGNKSYNPIDKHGNQCIHYELGNNFHYISDTQNHLDKMNSGSILCLENWSHMMNDSFILGAISTKCHFYLVTNRNDYSITAPTKSDDYEKIKTIRKDSNLRLTRYAREIIACLVAGYIIKKLADGKEILVPSDNMKGLTLKKLIKAVTYFEQTLSWIELKHPRLIGLNFDFSKNKISKFIYR